MLQATTWADKFFNDIEQRGEFTEQDLDWLYQNKKLYGNSKENWKQWYEEVTTPFDGTIPAPAILPTKLKLDSNPHGEEPTLSNTDIRDDYDRFMVHLIWPVADDERTLSGRLINKSHPAQIELLIEGRTPGIFEQSYIVFEDV